MPHISYNPVISVFSILLVILSIVLPISLPSKISSDPNISYQLQNQCGKWNWEGPWNDKDLRIETTPITNSNQQATGEECHGAFRLGNRTATYGGYSFDVEINYENAKHYKDILPQKYITPVYAVEIHVVPTDKFLKAIVSIRGNVTVASIIVDTFIFLFKILLEFIPLGNCVISGELMADVAIRAHTITNNWAKLVLDGDFVGAANEISQVWDELINQLSEVLQNTNDVLAHSMIDCAPETIRSFLPKALKEFTKKPAILAKLTIAYLAWVPKIMYDYFYYSSQSADVVLEYNQLQGKRLINGLVAYVGADGNIWLVSENGQNAYNITSDATDKNRNSLYHALAWSPNGEYLAFIKYENEVNSLWIYNIKNKKFEKLQSNVSSIAWKPDSSNIAFDIQSPEPKGIWQVDIVTGKATELVRSTPGYFLTFPKWSPSGKYISFGEFSEELIEGSGYFAFYDVQKKLYYSWKERIGNYTWTSDDEHIVYDEQWYLPQAGRHLQQADIYGKSRKLVTSTSASTGDYIPEYSPSGNKIAFLRSEFDGLYPTSAPLWIVDTDGKNLRQITSYEVDGAVWSPDGKKLLVSKGSEIQIIDITTSNKAALKLADGMYPVWQPLTGAQGSGKPTNMAEVRDQSKIYLDSKLLLDVSKEYIGCFGVNKISYSPTGENFLVILACMEGDNEALLFRSDGTSKQRVTGKWDYINYCYFDWEPDGKSFIYARINSCCVPPEAIPTNAPLAGVVKYDVQTKKKTNISSSKFEKILYSVSKVSSDDTLSIRSQPNSESEEVGYIPFNGIDIQIIGKSVKVGDDSWVNIKYNRLIGWVNRYYLEEMPSSYENCT